MAMYQRPAKPWRPRYEFDPAEGLEVMRNPARGARSTPRLRRVASVRRNPSRARGPASLKEAYQQRAILSLVDAARLAGLTVRDLEVAMQQRKVCETRVDGVVMVRAEELAQLLGVRGLSRLARR